MAGQLLVLDPDVGHQHPHDPVQVAQRLDGGALRDQRLSRLGKLALIAVMKLLVGRIAGILALDLQLLLVAEMLIDIRSSERVHDGRRAEP